MNLEEEILRIKSLLIEQDGEKEQIIEVPSFSYFNFVWGDLQRFLKSKPGVKWGINGDLSLKEDDNLDCMENLVYVKGNLGLHYSPITTFKSLIYVTDSLDLGGSKIKNLGSLKSVGKNLNLIGTDIDSIKSFGDLEYVGGILYIYETPLSKNFKRFDIKDKIRVNNVSW